MRTLLLSCFAIVGLLSTPPAHPAAAIEPPPLPLSFIKGYSWGWTGRAGQYRTASAAESMAHLADTGADTVCIAFATDMPTAASPRFSWSEANPRMATDDDLRRAIGLARENRLRVILKPVVNCRDGVWRAWIKFYRPATPGERAAGAAGVLDTWRDEPLHLADSVVDHQRWGQWWDCYTAFILHYARLAAAEHVEMFCIGCEMSSTEEYEDRWRALIAAVRDVYSGPIVYNANHDRTGEVPWWDAVDLIGVSAYYAVPPPSGVSEADASRQTTPAAEIVAELQRVRAQLAVLSAKWDKPILFIETGLVSVRGSARHPWAHGHDPREHPTDEQEQANYYQAMCEVFYNEPWFAGFAWWDWPARLYDASDAKTNRNFCAYGKRAETVLRQWYAQPRP